MAKRSGYPDTYGYPTKALPDIMGPLNIQEEGDILVPPNDMAEVAPELCMGGRLRDPLDLVYCIETDGTKGKR
jgi:hypothetical protein